MSAVKDKRLFDWNTFSIYAFLEVVGMLNKRQKELIESFLNNVYLPMSYLTAKHHVSERTIRRDIREIEDDLRRFDIKIVFVTGRGYQLRDRDDQKEDRLREWLVQQSDLSTKDYIFLDLLERRLTSTELEERYLYSTTSIQSRIQKLNNSLRDYSVRLEGTPEDGWKVEGEEWAIRKYLMDHYFRFSNNLLTRVFLPDFDEKRVAEVRTLLHDRLYQHGLVIADADFSNLLALLIIAMKRHHRVVDEVKAKRYDDFLKDLVMSANEAFGTEMGFYEIDYLANHSIFGEKEVDHIEDRINAAIQRSIERINQSHANYYSFRPEFYEAISQHIDLMIKRSLKNSPVQNPLINEIKPKYVVEFTDAAIIAECIEKEFNIEVSEDEIGFLAIHLGATRLADTNHINVILICNYGIGTSQIVRRKIEKENKQVQILGVYPSAFLDQAMLLEPDYVISTVRLPDYRYSAPPIEADKYLLNPGPFLFDDVRKKHLTELFRPRLFFDIDVNSREEFFELAFAKIRQVAPIEDSVLEEVRKRDELASTDVGNFIAIPHTVTTGSFQSFIAVFRLAKPILWKRNQTSFVFMLVIHGRDRGAVRALECLYDYILDPENLVEMRQATDFHSFVSNILKRRD